jgi:hypothetical protein
MHARVHVYFLPLYLDYHLRTGEVIRLLQTHHNCENRGHVIFLHKYFAYYTVILVRDVRKMSNPTGTLFLSVVMDATIWKGTGRHNRNGSQYHTVLQEAPQWTENI